MGNKYEIAVWVLITIATVLFVAIGFPETPEVEETLAVEESIVTYYDVPLDDELQNYISELCNAYEVDMPLVLAIIGQESNYNPSAVGDNGESIGLMQIQPRWHQSRMDKLGVSDLSNPYQNVTVGIDLLAELLAKDKGFEWAVTAYNAGTNRANFNKNYGILSEYTEGVLKLREELLNECR